MSGPIIWIPRERRARLVHRFRGATPRSPVVVVTPDASEAAEAAEAALERQRRRLADRGSAFSERLDAQRPQWRDE